jgi:ribonuclease D
MMNTRRVNVQPKKIYVHTNDLPDWVTFKESVAIDTEAMGLCLRRDRLCLVQLTFGDEICHIIQINRDSFQESPNLVRLLEDDSILKIFHFARFDVALLYETFGILTKNIYCTKIASKLARTYTERHGLKSVCMELFGIEISKKEQSSDWGKAVLTEEQKLYAANDVLYLHLIRERLDKILERENRKDIAEECFRFLPNLARLDCLGWSESLFSHL